MAVNRSYSCLKNIYNGITLVYEHLGRRSYSNRLIFELQSIHGPGSEELRNVVILLA